MSAIVTLSTPCREKRSRAASRTATRVAAAASARCGEPYARRLRVDILDIVNYIEFSRRHVTNEGVGMEDVARDSVVTGWSVTAAAIALVAIAISLAALALLHV